METNPNTIQSEENTALAVYASMMIDIPETDKHPANASPFTPETKAFYEFAQERLAGKTIQVKDNSHSALMYALTVYTRAEELVNDNRDVGLTNQLFTVSLMVALEKCYYNQSTWSYGSRLLYDLKAAGINLKRPVIAAFLAQEGTWDTNRSKSDLLNGNPVAVGIYCGDLKALCHTIADKSEAVNTDMDLLEKIEQDCPTNTPEEMFDYYLKAFALPYLESRGSANAEQQITAFQNWLARSDFYRAPCSTKYHLNRAGGLQDHTANVLMQMLWLTMPATKQQIGACVLAAIGHDLCKVNVYTPQTKSKKIYLEAGSQAPDGAQVKTDQGGYFYWGSECYYEFKDTMPFGHGRKSAYILQSFFPEIGEDVFCAVDGHMADAASNWKYLHQFAECPMALNLHIADALATYLVEYQK